MAVAGTPDAHTNLDSDPLWRDISKAIDQLYQNQQPSPQEFMQLYTNFYDYCTKPRVPAVPSTSSQQNDSDKRLVVRTNIEDNCSELYYKITIHLETIVKKFHTEALRSKGEDLVRFYTTKWEQYQHSSTMFHACSRPLHRYWIQREIESGSTSIHDIHTLAIMIWQSELFRPLYTQVVQKCLQLITSERNNGLVNESIPSYVELRFMSTQSISVANNPTTASTPDIYQNHFETPFLEDTRNYYCHQATLLLHRSSMAEYMKKTPHCFIEVDRVRTYFCPSTFTELMDIIDAFIRQQLEAVYVEAQSLINDKNYQDLALLFQFVSLVPDASVRLQEMVKMHFDTSVSDAFEGISDQSLQNPKVYMEHIIGIYREILQSAVGASRGCVAFADIIDKICRTFVNANPVIARAGGVIRAFELLVRYCDILLRKTNTAIDGTYIEQRIDEIMMVFNYLDDKDAFGKFYGKMLGKRLICRSSASDDYEELMIVKLGQACGIEYTSKLRRMFHDILISKDLINQYRAHSESSTLGGSMYFSALVLTSNVWPFVATTNIILPQELQRVYDSFTRFYTLKFNGRKLGWLHQHSTGELQTLYTHPRYTLRVSTNEATLLLLFNKLPCWTVQRMQEATQIHMEIFLHVLCGLLNSKVIQCSEITETEVKESDIKMDYNIRIAEDFRSNMLKINLIVPPISIERRDVQVLDRQDREDRKINIQATIVRTMKTHGRLRYVSLIQEVIERLSAHFRPEIPMITECIELLINKEYLRRHHEDNEMLEYLA